MFNYQIQAHEIHAMISTDSTHCLNYDIDIKSNLQVYLLVIKK